MENREAQKQRRRTKNERKQQRRREEYSLAAAASDSGDGLLQSKARSESKLTDIQLKSVTQGFLDIQKKALRHQLKITTFVSSVHLLHLHDALHYICFLTTNRLETLEEVANWQVNFDHEIKYHGHTTSYVSITVKLGHQVRCIAKKVQPSSSSPISRSSSLLKKNGSLTIRLVHRSSPESPFYDSNATREDLIREGLNISLARSRYYGQGIIYQTNSLYATTPISHDFVMKYTIGALPFETVGILDTRSILIWMQCLPCLQCRRDQITDPMFDPKSSTTFMNVPCDAILCTEISSTYCIGGTCNYHVEYLNEKTSDGVIAMDVLGVEALVSGAASFPNPAIFGCGFNNCDLAGNSHEVIGLGNGSNSFLKQIPANQFTYLFSKNGSDIGGWIYFGLEGLVSGYPTLLVPNEFGSYYLILEGISVDGEMLNIPSEDFNLKNDGTGGFSIDLGCTFTLLRDNAFDALRQEIMRYWDEEEPTNVDGFKFCFEDMTPALEIVFNFKDYNLSLSTDNAWVKACEPHYCLAMSRSHSNLYVLGMHQQRNLEVGYYLDLQVVSFSSPSAV
ncbi:hypothetical protein RHGRI_028613 [Rhododendron griersonianum]|uniref:Peptidase A1 domain-containing protein n=1 Tax=Rhododendron griersonianum TaxID=479676 RepID=A0AAV6IH52_9ERIC|nr:hypothetical protein RHGRI_028613 [Rhododendron griersonianum]